MGTVCIFHADARHSKARKIYAVPIFSRLRTAGARRTVQPDLARGSETKSKSTDWRVIGCAALVGASVAFPLGLVVGAGDPPQAAVKGESRQNPPSGQVRAGRDPYSPKVTSDPYVIEQQRRVLQALEVSCRGFKTHCAEARQARLRIEEAEGSR
jgi:hypothetical protein